MLSSGDGDAAYAIFGVTQTGSLQGIHRPGDATIGQGAPARVVSVINGQPQSAEEFDVLGTPFVMRHVEAAWVHEKQASVAKGDIRGWKYDIPAIGIRGLVVPLKGFVAAIDMLGKCARHFDLPF